jgi:hypothetical protein
MPPTVMHFQRAHELFVGCKGCPSARIPLMQSIEQLGKRALLMNIRDVYASVLLRHALPKVRRTRGTRLATKSRWLATSKESSVRAMKSLSSICLMGTH